jgi:Neuraminidase (sialidase)
MKNSRQYNDYEDQPFQCKTLKLSSLKEGKLIQFEEFEPLNASHRNDGLHTGGRYTSCQSNSNKFSMNKTFNFQLAFLGSSSDDKDNVSLPESTRPLIVDEREKAHQELTEKVD